MEANRLVSIHQPGSPEYNREKAKLLPEGKTCGDCVYRLHCVSMFQDQNTYCQFYPNKFEQGEAKPLKAQRKKKKYKLQKGSDGVCKMSPHQNHTFSFINDTEKKKEIRKEYPRAVIALWECNWCGVITQST